MSFGKSQAFFSIIVVICSTSSTTAKIFGKCELAQELLKHNVPKEDVPIWVCIATHESSLDSEAINKQNWDGSWDHGLWQISDKWWVGRNDPAGGCSLTAAEVRGDDITKAVACVRTVWEEHQRLQGNGWMAWAVYSNQGHCKNDLSSYVNGCF